MIKLLVDVRPIKDWERKCIMTVEQFTDDVKRGCLIDYDGFAHPSYLDMVDQSITIRPSDVKKGKLKDLCIAPTHVVWYNR